MNRKQFLTAVLAMPFASRAVHAEPRRPLRLVVGFVAGAMIDTLERRLAERMSPILDRPVIVENRPGAGGRIANQVVKSAAADGQTLLLTPSATMAIYPHSHEGRLDYDPLRDFTPIAHLCSFQTGLAVGRGVPVTTLREYLSWVREEPAQRGFYATAAAGSTSHFVYVMLEQAEGLSLTHVPYLGTAAAMRALMAGEIPALATGMADLRTLARHGHATVLAVNGVERDAVLEQVPTFQELGYELESTSWYGLFAPAALDPILAAKLGDAATAAMADPWLRQELSEAGLRPTGRGPDFMAATLATDHKRWGQLIRATGFTVAG